METISSASKRATFDSDCCESLYHAGGMFDLSSDWLIQTHVVTFYWLAMDTSGAALVSKVADQQSLALRLVEVLAHRVQVLIVSKTEEEGLVNVQSKVSSNLSMWLETARPAQWLMDKAVVVETARGIQNVCSLANLIMKLLPESHSLYSICQNSLDSINLLYNT